jgi:hypothetical protein
MGKLSFNEYALMSYRMDVRCFTATTNSIRDLDSLNFFIDVNDGIYRDIVGDVRGGIITPGMIEDDPFLRKRFPSQKVSGRSSYYINVLKNIARGTMHETLGGGAADAWECCFTPVVVVRLADDAETADPGRITGLLARDLSLPFMLHIRNESRAVRIEECTNIHRAFRLLEFMFQTFVHEGTGACFIITCGDDFSAERRYVIPYFKARVTALAGGKTMISHIDKNRIVIFAAAPDAGKVESLLSEWNRLYPHVFMHRSVESREKMSFSGFLSDHIFQ